jgi:hypothetical protein
MKKVSIISGIFALLFLISVTCTQQVQTSEEPAKIENTLQSVSYLKDTIGNDPQLLLGMFTRYNEAIDSIGYPEAGYKLWIIQEDTSDVTFMIEGFWPNQEAYNIIHNHPLYKKAGESEENEFSGMVRVKYHRFIRVN